MPGWSGPQATRGLVLLAELSHQHHKWRWGWESPVLCRRRSREERWSEAAKATQLQQE